MKDLTAGIDPRRAAVIAAAGEVRAEWALLTDPGSVAYGAGHAAGIETGPSPFDGGPTAALIAPDGTLRITCNELEAAGAEAAGAEVFSYEALGYADQRPLPVKYAEALGRMLDAAEVSGTVAVQAASCPAAAMSELGGRTRLAWLDESLDRRRAIKSEAEIAALRHCAAVTAAGHAAVPGALRAGRTELETWAEVRLAMEAEAGARLPVAGDFVTGRARTAAIGGPPGPRRLERGDPVIADLAPRVGGYWGDSATTTWIGAPSRKMERMHTTVLEAWNMVLETLRPGVTCAAFDAPVRAHLRAPGYANDIHMGHGIGTSVHEWPRLVPGNDAVIQPGMVLMVEPGAYHPEVGGVRVEQMFLITGTGYEILSPFEISRELVIV